MAKAEPREEQKRVEGEMVRVDEGKGEMARVEEGRGEMVKVEEGKRGNGV